MVATQLGEVQMQLPMQQDWLAKLMAQWLVWQFAGRDMIEAVVLGDLCQHSWVQT